MGRALIDDSSRVSEGHTEDWQEWDADVEYGEDHERFRVFGAVRYEPITQIQGIEVTAASPMTRYGAMPEVRTHAMIRRYFGPRGRDTWQVRQDYLVRGHATHDGDYLPLTLGSCLMESIFRTCHRPGVRRSCFSPRINNLAARTLKLRDDWTSPDEGTCDLRDGGCERRSSDGRKGP